MKSGADTHEVMYAVPKELGAYDEGDKGVGPYTIKITDVLPNGNIIMGTGAGGFTTLLSRTSWCVTFHPQEVYNNVVFSR